MRKIMFYIGNINKGGAERVMTNLIAYFCEQGYDVALVNDRPGQDGYCLPSQVRRLYLEQQPATNFLIRTFLRVQRLRRILKQEKPSIAVSFLGEPNFRMLAAGMGLSVKKVVSVRNDPKLEYGSNRLQQAVANIMFMFADGVVFQTQEAAAYFNKKIQKKSRCILNPVHSLFFQQTKVCPGRHVIAVARLEPQKNYSMLIQAYAAVAQEYPHDDLVIYGEGSQRQALQALVQRLGIEKRVHLKGSCDQIEQRLAQSRVFVLSSDYEGMPNALMEAMAVGLPVIATDCPCGGPRTLITGAEEGILVQAGNVKQLEAALRQVLSDNTLSERLAKGAAKRAQAFRPELVLKQWECYLSELCM